MASTDWEAITVGVLLLSVGVVVFAWDAAEFCDPVTQYYSPRVCGPWAALLCGLPLGVLGLVVLLRALLRGPREPFRPPPRVTLK